MLVERQARTPGARLVQQARRAQDRPINTAGLDEIFHQQQINIHFPMHPPEDWLDDPTLSSARIRCTGGDAQEPAHSGGAHRLQNIVHAG